MTIRFFILQAHYRSTLDFSNEALKAAEKGLERLFTAGELLDKIKPSQLSSVNINELRQNCYNAMNDDFNSPIVIANLFEAVRIINSIFDGKETIDQFMLEELKKLYNTFVFDILGMKPEKSTSNESSVLDNVVDLLLNIRIDAKASKNWETADRIRNELTKFGFEIKDTKDGFEWELK
jgi:cysteinyl-tRNA synthetase